MQHFVASAIWQKQIMQITTSWEQKGRTKGQKEGQVATIIRQLNRKLGNLPEAIAER
ncbi:MAG: hypothetical protein RLZZ574_1663, partial [Cyanobacteriota bacterium]